MPISTRNSAPAVVNLLTKTSCHHVVFEGGSAIDQGIRDIQQLLDNEEHEINFIPFPSIDSLFPSLGDTADSPALAMYPPVTYHSQDKPAMYLHSSGSTGFPKPIPLTQRYILQLMDLRKYQVRRLKSTLLNIFRTSFICSGDTGV